MSKEKIKKTADLLYEKQINGIMGTAGHDPYSLNLANKGDTQSESNQKDTPVGSNIPQITPKVNVKIERLQQHT